MDKNKVKTEDNQFDAIVVGTGISGGWAAKELCEQGFKTFTVTGSYTLFKAAASRDKQIKESEVIFSRNTRINGVKVVCFGIILSISDNPATWPFIELYSN